MLSNLSLDPHSLLKIQPHIGVMPSLPRNVRMATKAERGGKEQAAEPQREAGLCLHLDLSLLASRTEGTSICCQKLLSLRPFLTAISGDLHSR